MDAPLSSFHFHDVICLPRRRMGGGGSAFVHTRTYTHKQARPFFSLPFLSVSRRRQPLLTNISLMQ